MCGHAGAVHFIRWTIEKVGLIYYRTNGMLADAVTKPLFAGPASRSDLRDGNSCLLPFFKQCPLFTSHYTDTIGRLSVRDKQTTDPRGDRQ